MDMKIMWAALIFVGGWFYFYICLRQLIFDFTVGFPLISKFGAAGETVFAATGAKRLNIISVIIWALICVGIGWVVIRFCPTYLLVSFWAGAVIGLACFAKRLGPGTKSNLEAWLRTYCRFMPDDALRMACYEADLPKLRSALRALNAEVKLDIKKG